MVKKRNTANRRKSRKRTRNRTPKRKNTRHRSTKKKGGRKNFSFKKITTPIKSGWAQSKGIRQQFGISAKPMKQAFQQTAQQAQQQTGQTAQGYLGRAKGWVGGIFGSSAPASPVAQQPVPTAPPPQAAPVVQMAPQPVPTAPPPQYVQMAPTAPPPPQYVAQPQIQFPFQQTPEGCALCLNQFQLQKAEAMLHPGAIQQILN